MTKVSRSLLPAWLFAGFGSTAIIAGGMLAAFSASHPTRLALWMSAYLVLVVGVLQVCLGIGAYLLSTKPSRKVTVLAFTAYNLGNLGVIVGTTLKNSNTYSTNLVDAGGLLLAIAMILLLYLVRRAHRSWLLIAFYAVAAVLLVSMPIGLFLAHRTSGV